MNNSIKIIRKEFRRSQEARYFHRLHGVLLVLKGLSTVKAGALLGDPQRSVAHWLIQYKEHGLNGLKDAPKSGRPAALNPRQMKTLLAALKRTPASLGMDGNKWTGSLVAEFLSERCNVKLTMRHSRRLLRKSEQAAPS